MKKLFFFISLVLFIIPLSVGAESIMYDDAVDMVQEVMKQYYIRGPYIQYNLAKTIYTDLDPEEATLQDNKYIVCAGFTHNIYNQAFGIKGEDKFMSGLNEFKENVFPQYNYHFAYAAQSTYQKIRDNKIEDDGTLLLYYQSNVDTRDNDGDKEGRDREIVKYVYGDTDQTSDAGDFETLVKNVKPGDIFFFSGHVLIAYKTVDTNNDGKIDDVLLLNTVGHDEITSRIYSTSSLYYDATATTRAGKEILNLEKEGTIQLILLSGQGRFVQNGVLKCKNTGSTSVSECAVIRPFYKGKNGEAVFNFQQSVNETNESKKTVKKSILRTKYPGLLIEKTVSKGDNNSVYVGDELTYTIKITNKSSVDTTENNLPYGEFTIEESFDKSIVDYVKCSEKNCIVENNQIKMSFSGLDVSSAKTITYTVKVKNDPSLVGKVIESIGSFYDNEQNKGLITTGVVKNKIIPKVEKLKNTYESCFNNNKKNYSGLDLINEVYKCATDNDFKFDKIDFNNFFVKVPDTKTNSTINFVEPLDADYSKIKSMILNNYFSGVAIEKKSAGTLYYLPSWPKSSSMRAMTVNSMDFKEGDILIYEMTKNRYTNEDGMYAFIYINGSFVGVNGTGCATRNNFTYEYHSDAYWQNIECDNKLTIGGSLFNETKWNAMTEFEKEFINYQTLFGKNNYIVLRPEIMMKELSKIEVATVPSKTSYLQNVETLNLSGGKIKAIYNDGTTEIIDMTNSKVKVDGFDNSTLGTKTLIVTCDGKTTSYTLNIIKKETLQDKFTSIGFKIKNKFVHGFKLEDTLNDIKNKVNLDYDVVTNLTKIATGVQFKYNSEIFTAVIYGDLNGDGKINSADLLKMRQHLLGISILDEAYKEAATITNNNTINSANLLRLRQHLLGQMLIEQ